MTVVKGRLIGVEFTGDTSALKKELQNNSYLDLFFEAISVNTTAYIDEESKEFVGNKSESALLGLTQSLGCNYKVIFSFMKTKKGK